MLYELYLCCMSYIYVVCVCIYVICVYIYVACVCIYVV